MPASDEVTAPRWIAMLPAIITPVPMERHIATPASDIATAGFLTKLTTPVFTSLAILCGLARSARESTVTANWSRA